MKNLTSYILISLAMASLLSCEPIEKRLELGDAISSEELVITAHPMLVNGKSSNKVILDNKSPVLSSWDFGIGVTQKKTDTVLMVLQGENEILFTGLNPDGTKVSKTIKVIVDTLAFPVPPEWALLTDGKEKSWKWDETKPAVWGNGGYMGSIAPAWWTLKEADIDGQAAGEGVGATMIFGLRGAQLMKVKANGDTVKGNFSFNMDKPTKLVDGTIWAKGKLTSKNISVLAGISPNEGNAPVLEYDILLLNDKEMVLSYPEPGAGAWGNAWFWVFRAVD